MVANNRRISGYFLLAVILLAAFFRFWQLESLPPGLYHDEAYNGLDALSLNQGKLFPQFYEGWEGYAADAHAEQPAKATRFPVFFEGNYGREPLHIYLMALSINLFGATPFAIRAIPAAAGVLAVAATFLAARMLFSEREEADGSYLVPLLAALVVAILYPAIHFSRFGIRAMVFVPVETMAVACFWWGVSRREKKKLAKSDAATWLIFLLSGFFLGLALYTFAASRLLPLVWIIFVPLWFLQDREAFWIHWRHVAGMAGAALLTSLPLLLFFLRYPYYFVFRIAYVANRGKGVIEGRPGMTWLLNVGRVLRGLLWQGETHLRHNLPGRPYLDPIQAVFFLLGVIKTLRRIAQPRFQFLLIWFVVMLLPSILSGDAPHFGRLSGAAVPMAILVALGIAWLYDRLRLIKWGRYGSGGAQKATILIIVSLLMASTLWSAVDYFVRYAQHPDLATDFYLADWQLGQYAREEGADSLVYLSPTQEELATILYALEDGERLRNYSSSQELVPAGVPGTAALYLLRADEQAELAALRAYFPEGKPGREIEGYLPLKVGADAARNRLAAETDLDFGQAIRLIGLSIAGDDESLQVRLAWQGEAEMEKNYTAFIHLVNGAGNLLAQQDRQPAGYPTSDWQPGEVVVDSFAVSRPDGLAADDEISLRTGFYYLPTSEALGETVELASFTWEQLDLAE